MSKHTPGPWRVNDQRESGVMNNGVYVLGGRNNFVRVFDEWRDEEIQLANARLIAAAPELLDALKSVQAARQGHYWLNEITEKIDAAIAKAMGEA